MSNWVLTKGLTSWRGEINDVFPRRNKASDGSVGDLVHQEGVSGHNPEEGGHAEYNDGDALNEVRAIDVTKDLEPGSKTDWMEVVIQFLVERGRAGKYLPFRYIIYKGRIWTKSSGWVTRTYTGRNKHDHHAHFSGDYNQTADNWVGKLGLATYINSLKAPQEDVVEQADIDKIVNGVAAKIQPQIDALKNEVNNVAAEVWQVKLNSKVVPTRTTGQGLADLANGLRAVLWFSSTNKEAVAAKLPADAPLRTLLNLSTKIDKYFTDEVNRDGQDAARDASLIGMATRLIDLAQASENVALSAEQYDDLKRFLGEKMVEAGEDAAVAATWKLNQIAEALDNAGQALATANDAQPQQ